MSELFLSVLNMSLTASYVILFVILVRLLLKKAPKVISYALWAVVAFRLIIPFSFESMFSLMPRNINTVPIRHDIIYQQSPQINRGLDVVDSLVSNSLPPPTIGASVNPLQIYMEIGAYIWVLGIMVLLIYSFVSILRLKRQLKSAQLIEQNIFEAKNLKTPFVLGLIKPKVYLPVGLNDSERSYILLHEQTHIHRKDHIIKILAFLILSIHWFNPLVWIAFMLMSTDMELFCDERVLKKINEDIKKNYANSLLSLAAGRHILNGSPLAFGEGNVKGRIKNVLSYRKPSLWVVAVSIAATIIVGIALITNSSDNNLDMPSGQHDRDPSYKNVQEQERITDEEENNLLLLNKPVEDKVCLGLFTTEQADPESYYMPDGETQKKLIPLMANLDKTEKPEGIFKGRHYLGINIVFQGLEWQVLSDGSLYHFSPDESGYKEYFAVNKELSERVLQIAEQDLGIAPFNPKIIKNIKSAELTVAFYNNKEKVYKQIITDNSALSTIEKLFSEAEIINGGTGCPFTEGIMTLMLEDGQQIKIAMATDSCCVYFVNGMYFDYKPAEMRGKEDSGIYNNIVFDYFDKIPIATRGEVKDNLIDDGDFMPDFTDEEVASARAVVEEYFRSIQKKDDEAILKTLTPMYNHPNVVLYGDEMRTLLSIDYNEDDPMRKSYVEYGRGSINSTKLEDVIVFRVSFNVKYPKGASSSFNEGDYTNWSIILIRDSKESSWLIDDQGY